MVRALREGPGSYCLPTTQALKLVPVHSHPEAFVNVFLPFLNAELEYRLLNPLAQLSFGHMLAKPHYKLTFLESFVPPKMGNFLERYGLLGSGPQANLASYRAVFVPSAPRACYPPSAGCDVCLPGLSAPTATDS